MRIFNQSRNTIIDTNNFDCVFLRDTKTGTYEVNAYKQLNDYCENLGSYPCKVSADQIMNEILVHDCLSYVMPLK